MTGQDVNLPLDGASIESHTAMSYDAIHAMPLEFVPAHDLKENGDAVSCVATAHFAAKTNLPIQNLSTTEMANLLRCIGKLDEPAPPSTQTVNQQLADAATKEGGATETTAMSAFAVQSVERNPNPPSLPDYSKSPRSVSDMINASKVRTQVASKLTLLEQDFQGLYHARYNGWTRASVSRLPVPVLQELLNSLLVTEAAITLIRAVANFEIASGFAQSDQLSLCVSSGSLDKSLTDVYATMSDNDGTINKVYGCPPIPCCILGLCLQFFTPTVAPQSTMLQTVTNNLSFYNAGRDFDVVAAARKLSDAVTAVTRARAHANWDGACRAVIAALAECATEPDRTIGIDNTIVEFSPQAIKFVIEASTRQLDQPYVKADLVNIVNFLDTYARNKSRESALIGSVSQQRRAGGA